MNQIEIIVEPKQRQTAVSVQTEKGFVILQIQNDEYVSAKLTHAQADKLITALQEARKELK